MYVYVRDKLDVFEGKLESYLTYMNETETLTPVILQVKELITVTKGKNISYQCSIHLCGKLVAGAHVLLVLKLSG
jgi:hypothetical protein